MAISLTCKRCATTITAESEDDLVTKVQSHILDDHGGAHSPTRVQILKRLHRRESGKHWNGNTDAGDPYLSARASHMTPTKPPIESARRSCMVSRPPAARG